MSDTENLQSASDSVETVTVTKVKKERTPAQLAALTAAREKAMKIRSEQKDLRMKAKEVDSAKKEAAKREHREKIEREHAALKSGRMVEEVIEEERPVAKAKKPVSRRIVVVEESSSSSEEEIQVRTRKKKQPEPEVDPAQLAAERRYAREYNRLFPEF